ncbi:MAG: hypothetical protein JSS02_05835 [Planctomycetes bacterium]|nr:hypothetical protein [Planctomycetota bacterium]
MMNDRWSTLVINLATQSPILLTYLVVIVIALAKRKKHPRPSFLLVLAATVSVVLGIGYSVLNDVIFAEYRSGGMEVSRLGLLSAGLRLVSSLIRIVAVALWVAAVYVGRQPTPAEPPDEN